MVLTLKSLEFMNGVEAFRIEENEEDVSGGKVAEKESVSVETDAGMALMLEWKMRLSEDSDMCTTCQCSVDFQDRSAILEHYQSLFHRTNILRKAKNLPIFEEEDFDGTENDDHDLTQSSQTLSATVESDDEEFDALLLPANRAFFVRDDHVFSIPRNILHVDETDVTNSTFLRPFNCTIILWNGGHFAAAVFENDRTAAQKSFHRYVARAKQGGVQSQHDSGGKGAAKSAGAQLRRYNEQKMKEEIQQMVRDWSQHLQKTPLVFIRCATYHRSVFFEANADLYPRDARIRTIPFETKRPTKDEVEETWRRLQEVRPHGTNSEFRSEMEEIREKRKELARKVAGRKRKDGGLSMICEWSDHDDENKDEQSVKKARKTQQIRVRAMRKASEDVVQQSIQWPGLDDEWRQKTYNLIRRDDATSLREHVESLNEDVKNEAIDYLRNAKIPPNRSHFLHVSAANSAKNCLKYLLDDVQCDSGAKDGAGLPPYSSSANAEIKSIFVDYRSKNDPSGPNWGRTHIPEPKKRVELTEEQEKEKAEKQREKKQRQKARERTKKEEQKQMELENAECQKYREMSERERRAQAVERRLAGLPPIMRCHQCGRQLPPTPFQYSHFNFCTTDCVAGHRKANP